MRMLWHYQMKEALTNRDAGYSMWGFGTWQGRDYFIKQFLSPKYPAGDQVSSPERIRKKQAECTRFEERQRRIYQAVNRCSDGNCVRIREFFRLDSKYYISMERIEALPWTAEAVASLTEWEKRRLCTIIAHSVAALHREGLVHADLKHENILFTRTKAGTVTAKIIDFDSVFFEAEPPGEGESVVGDWAYFPPEVWRRMDGEDLRLDTKIDVFALGVLFHRYFSGEFPGFDEEAYSSVGQALQYEGEVTISPRIPVDLQELIARMLSAAPEDRPDSEGVFRVLRRRLPGGEGDSGNLRRRYCVKCGAPMDGSGSVCPVCTAMEANPDGSGFFHPPAAL
ncbi:MAG: hypothetical protein E7464_05965 [Ruminococcaceae bacterium]|nr:hypothetical protein [Oscillospiraceae bacterium]